MNMKDLLYRIVLVTAICMVLASCNDSDYNEKVNSIILTNAETTIGAAGDAKSFAVESPSTFTAKAVDSWLKVSVDSNKVKISADVNLSVSARNTIVVIKNDRDSTLVNVSQLGAVFDISAGGKIYFKDAGGSSKFVLKANLPATFETSADWITYSVDDKNITVTSTPNSTGDYRIGYLKYHCGNKTDSVRVVQGDASDLKGKWTISYYDVDETGKNFTQLIRKATLTPYSNGDSVKVAVIPGVVEIHCLFDKGNLVMHAGDLVGTIDNNGATYYLCLAVVGNNNLYTSKQLISTAYPEIESDKMVFDFMDSGQLSSLGIPSESFGVFVFSSPYISYGAYKGSYMYFEFPSLYKYIK